MNRELKTIEYELQAHLHNGEELQWVGVPKQGINFTKNDIFMIPFSLMWGGFAVFWEFSVVSSGAPFFFMLWGIPFIVMGLYITVGRFFYDAYRRKKTFYGLTQKRVIIKSGIMSQTIKSLNLKTLSDVTLEEKSNGMGTVVLGSEMPFASMLRGTSWPTGGKTAPLLEMIPNASKVYQQITNNQNELFN